MCARINSPYDSYVKGSQAVLAFVGKQSLAAQEVEEEASVVGSFDGA